MTQAIRYGERSHFELDLSTLDILADCRRPKGVALDDPAAAVQASLADPLDFPPLESAVVPGDRVVIAVDRDVPQAAAIVAGITQSLLNCQHAVGSVEVVVPDAESLSLEQISEPLRSHLRLSVHDPSHREGLSYLAASKEGQPIYFNKSIGDADLVLPVTTVRVSEAWGSFGSLGGLFPTFSDEATQRRFRVPKQDDWSTHQRKRCEEVEEATWLLGIQLSIQVIPGSCEEVLGIIAGAGDEVQRRAQLVCREAWACNTAGSAQLAIATLEGNRKYQTWNNFARALHSASQVVTEGGAVLICTELSCPPGPALSRLAGAADGSQVVAEISREQPTDAFAALMLAEARGKASVYLLSQLDPNFVEDLGVGYVRDVEDVERLSRQYNSCILLGSAQHAHVKVADEAAIK